MESVILRSAIIYIFVYLMLRLAGKRTLSEMTTFDLILLLIISESTQQALLNNDRSITGSMLVIVTLVFLDITFTTISAKSSLFDRIFNGVPVFLLEEGKLHLDRMEKAKIQLEDILEAARTGYGLENINEIKSAVLEKNGSISIIPRYKDELMKGIAR